MPKKGFDVYMIDRMVMDVPIQLNEKNSALTGQILWGGFKTGMVFYDILERTIGKSKWTFKKKFKLAMDKVINTNLKGTYNIVKSVEPYMEEAGKGVIVTVGSIVGEYGNIGQVNYAASKAGVVAMTKTWAKEFARKGAQIRVNCVAPGYTMTDMLKTVPAELLDKFKGMTMLKRLAEPE